MDAALGWLPLVLALLLVLGWYLSYSAARLDRLHHRVESARAALDAQLVRRASAAAEVADLLDPPEGPTLAAAAHAARRGEDAPGGADLGPEAAGLREGAENELTKVLHVALDDRTGDPWQVSANPDAVRRLNALAAGCARVQLARRFHNDAVAQAQRVRRKRVVRWARLAGRARMPQMVEIDDRVPAALAGPARAVGPGPART